MDRVSALALLIISLALLTFFVTVPLPPFSGQSPSVEWATTFGSGGSLNSAATALYVDSSGIYSAGYDALSNGEFGGYNAVVFVQKFSLNGSVIWWKNLGTMGTRNLTQVYAMSGGPEGVYVSGSLSHGFYENDSGQTFAWVQKYDLNGNNSWIRKFSTNTTGQPTATGASLDAMSVGKTGIYITGGAIGPLTSDNKWDSNHGPWNISSYVRKYGLDGTEIWTRRFANERSGVGVYADENGVYVVGLQGAIRKFDTNGTLVWIRQLGTLAGDQGEGISGDSTGVYVVGTTNHYGLIRKYALNGDELWTHQLSAQRVGYGYPQVGGLQVSASPAGIFLVGSTNGVLPGQTFQGPWDSFIRKYSSDGTEAWTYQFGPADSQAIYLSTDGAFVAGSTLGAIFGKPHYGQTNAFIVKFSLPSSFAIIGVSSPWSYGLATIFALGLAAALVLVIEMIRRRRNRMPFRFPEPSPPNAMSRNAHCAGGGTRTHDLCPRP